MNNSRVVNANGVVLAEKREGREIITSGQRRNRKVVDTEPLVAPVMNFEQTNPSYGPSLDEEEALAAPALF